MILKKILTFFKSTLSNGTDASSKRFVGVGTFFVIIAVVFINIFTGRVPDPNVFGGLISLEVIAFGGIAVENVSTALQQFKQGKNDNTGNDGDGAKGVPKANL